MIILGLQFGHDGSVCVLKEGRILSYVYGERYRRIKHVIGITTQEIDRALKEAGVSVEQIDCCAIVSTQNVELLTGLIDRFSIHFEEHDGHAAPSPLARLLKEQAIPVTDRLKFALRHILRQGDKNSLQYMTYRNICPELDQVANGDIETVGWLDDYVNAGQWAQGSTLEEISRRDAAPLMQEEAIKYGFHYPVTVTFRGRSIPAYFVHHHVAHAASCFYRSPFEEAAVLTHDGFGNGVGYHSGLILYGRGTELFALGPHHLVVGALYDSVSLTLNLVSGGLDGAGKLMGLAPYGEPRFFQRELAGNWFDAERRFQMNQIALWHRHCNAEANRMGYDLSTLGKKDRMTDPINADLAASTQMLFEECYLQAVRATKGLLQNSGIESDNLCLSGGTALNCPSNSRVFQDGSFGNMFIEPSCGDEGLAIGGALYVHHHLYRNPVVRDAGRPSMSPYLGLDIRETDVRRALEAYASGIRYEKRNDNPEQAARDIHENKIIGWFEGRSESGPRALGHRSIVANPMQRANWERVNRIKQREVWRPFAPSVLEEESPNWFKGAPHPSPYMLFTGQVISSLLPAITHVDGSSRIQTVDPSVGDYYGMIKAFQRLSGVPVVLNTSLNGPGEPIVETPEQALAFFVKSELDALYMNGFRITRAGTD